ncbi:hypothetical protein ES703_32293 [subsurface metagenome]
MKDGNKKKTLGKLSMAEKLELKRQKVKHRDMRFLVETLRDFWIKDEQNRKQVERIIKDIVIEHTKEIEYLEKLLKGET